MINRSRTDRQAAQCLFCGDNHSSELCQIAEVNTKRNILKSQGTCFLCLCRKHIIKLYTLNFNCKIFSGKHNQTICLKSKLVKEEKRPELKNNEGEDNDKIISVISSNEKNKFLLQICCIKTK